MKIYLNVALLTCLIFSASAFCLGTYLTLPKKITAIENPVTTQKSGEKINISNWDTSGSTFRFTTTADGAGVAETVAPKTIIPEARAYIENVHCANALSGVLFHNFKVDPFFGAEYMRRFGAISAGGGGIVSLGGIVGVYGKAGLMF